MKANDRMRKGGLIRISEIYASIQGEGLLTGTPSVFARTSGCNLRCWFCDTPFASWQPEGDFFDAQQVAQQILLLPPNHVVITGGEPMIFPSLPALCELLYQAQRHITIETAGTIFQPVHCDLMSISPKLSSSAPRSAGAWPRRHESRRKRMDVLKLLISQYVYQLKFVVDSIEDANEVLAFLDELKDFDGQRVLLMPQGTSKPDLEQRANWLVPWCQSHGVSFCPRAHIEWFGNCRGT